MIVVWVLLGWFAVSAAFTAGWLACKVLTAQADDTRLMK
jgi:hypothetical protein